MLVTPPPSVPPGAGFTVTAYALALTPDLAEKTVAGSEVITLRATADGVRRLDFSPNAMVVDAAAVDGAPVGASHADSTLRFDLSEPLVRGRTVTLTVSYHGKPARGVATSANAIYTSYFACDWMVCLQDRFGDKADFALDLRVPAGLETLSVGRLAAKRSLPNGSVVWSWRAPRPYSAYLYAWSAGRFAHAEDRIGPAILTYLSDVADASELKRRFADTGEMVRFLADMAGVRLPVDNYTQLLMKGDEAQEAATYSVLGVDELPTTPGDPAEDWAIVHELTHEWWGNLVTCTSLREFWLNEGITTYMTAAWKEHRYGRAAYEAELDVARGRLAKARTKGFDKPLAWDGTYPTLGLRRAIQYSKGSLFMDHLRSLLGDDAFWTGLRGYTRAHAGGTVTSLDLERAMEAASGRDLRTAFAEWVFGPSADAAPQQHATG